MINIFSPSLNNEPDGESPREVTLLDNLLAGDTSKGEGEKFAQQVWTRALNDGAKRAEPKKTD